MPCSVKNFLLALLTSLALLSLPCAFAWDSVGHRVSAAIASNYLSDNSKTELLKILRQHPRYQQDFADQMPASIARGSEEARFVWLLGQAAFWPDITRGLPDTERERYNRANWHYIDGAWLRGQAQVQGNTYIRVAPFEDMQARTLESFVMRQTLTMLWQHWTTTRLCLPIRRLHCRNVPSPYAGSCI